MNVGFQIKLPPGPGGRTRRWRVVDVYAHLGEVQPDEVACVAGIESLRVGADLSQGDLIMVESTDEDLPKVVRIYELKSGLEPMQITKDWGHGSTTTELEVLGHWFYNPRDGVSVGKDDREYELRPGDPGYLRAIALGWDWKAHFEFVVANLVPAALREVMSVGVILHRDTVGAIKAFRFFLEDKALREQASKDAEKLKQALVEIRGIGKRVFDLVGVPGSLNPLDVLAHQRPEFRLPALLIGNELLEIFRACVRVDIGVRLPWDARIANKQKLVVDQL